MGRMNPLNTFLSLATLLGVFGQKLLNGVVIGGSLLITSQLKIYYLGKRYIKTIYSVIIFCLLVGNIYIFADARKQPLFTGFLGKTK